MGTENTVHVTSREELEFTTAFNRTMVETLENRKKLETGKNRTVISRSGRDSSDCESAASWCDGLRPSGPGGC
ncbi:hypothetical protein T03_3616 [Trichinella britovi]|uniref:Uncharacterized protein n=1 Tax=Trichinella britovi TaxID=45882 RepID=A0A0V1AHS8_TRIBR|nr:hypothetical protein T03_3616 [Trichinella britovi]